MSEIIVNNESVDVSVIPEVYTLNVSGIQTVLVNVSNAPGLPGEKGEPGDKGEDGAGATVAVGTVTTTAPNTSATVTNVGTSTNAVFNFGIPRGADGNINFLSVLQTDYDYDITGARNGSNRAFVLTANFITGTTKVFLNGVRQTIGANYDYIEQGNRIIIFNYDIDQGDLITVDYIIQT